MHASLLATKVRIPPRRPELVHRPRLSDALEAGLPYVRLALIAAPAGYGKTTLLSQWADLSRCRLAWLTLEATDNDIERFLRYLVTAWEAVQPGIMETPVGLLLGSTSPDIASVLSAFINAGSQIADQTVFVLDDCHLVTSEPVYQALSHLIDHLPPTLHFLIASRGEPPLPLARYRARGELLELGPEDLRFQEEETQAFLERQMSEGLAGISVTAVQAQVEGWAAGLQLLCHAIRRRPEATRSLAISGKHRFIADYLHEEVLADLDGPTRRFLLQTSILDHVHGEVCDATTGRTDSQHLLETLERDGLFLTALDETREWFRFHPLFADVLRQRLRQEHPGEVAQLHCRAARWFLDHMMPEEAFGHAIAGRDVDLALRIGEDYSVIKLESGELNVVERWLQMIPAAWFASYPLFDLLRVAFLIYTGAFEESARLLEDIEARMRRSNSEDLDGQLGKVATVRCAIACFQNDLPLAEAHASAALSTLPADDRFYRASIYHALGETYARNAYWDQAKDAFHRALQVAHEPSARIRSVHIFGALADLEFRQGRLEAAGDYWSRALAAIQERELWGRIPIPVTGWVFIRMGELLYERNRLGDARQHLARGLELAALGGDVRSLIAGSLLSARLSLTEGDRDRAAHDLDWARRLLEQASFPEWLVRFRRCQLELWLARHERRAIARWITSMAISDAPAAPDEGEIDRVTLARALIAQGRPSDRQQGITILRDLIEAAGAHGRQGIQIEALALLALALWDDGDRAGALTSLERALALAEPEGYLRVFADLGLPMTRLLREAQARKVMPEYVRALLNACQVGDAPHPDLAAALLEPLSRREQEVLSLIAAGLSNREIGEALFISAETVKKHTGHIYAKLQAGSRTEAVARARDLGLLDATR